MSRLPDSDPTATRILAGDLIGGIWGVLEDLDDVDREMVIRRYGLRDGQQRTFSEVAEVMHTSGYAVRAAESRALSIMRHARSAERLAEYLADDTAERISPALRSTILGGDRFAPELIHCERHGWSEAVGDVVCPVCPCYVRYGLTGRRRRYCSDACRQAAHRQRAATRNRVLDAD